MKHPNWPLSISLAWCLGISLVLPAQKNNTKRPPVDYLFKKEASGGARITQNGFTIVGQFGWIKNIYSTTFIEGEYFYHHNYQFKKIKSPIADGRDFYFGVQNRLHALRFGAGYKRTLADKSEQKGVRLSLQASGGISLALLKPYYLSIYYPDGPDSIPVFRDEKYTDANAERFIDRRFIAEASPEYLGMNEMEVIPGAHGKLSLEFDFGKRDAFIATLETGVIFDVYYKRLPLVINDTNRMYSGSFFVGFRLGKRW